jgi:DUF4097 and DUF4098 domain-containing protein YvlB
VTVLFLVAAALEVTAPVSFSVRTYAADVEVVAGPRVALTVPDKPAAHPAIRTLGGNRYEAEFDGKHQLHEGALRLELPAGSSVDVSTVTGRVRIAGISGPARVRGMSGAVRVAGATDVDVETVDGGIEVEGASGKVRIHTTSGVAALAAQSFGEVELETASGAATFRGRCGAKCHLDVDSVSGEVRFSLAQDSSFAASVITTSGHLRDELGVRLNRRESWMEGRYQGGDGVVECETFSGDIVFGPR